MIETIRSVVTQRNQASSEETDRSDTDESATASSESDILLAQDLVAQELQHAEAAFTKAWDENADLSQSLTALIRWHGWRTAATCLETVRSSSRPTFHIDTLTLADCYQHLFADPTTESIVYLTGISPVSNVWLLNRCIPFAHAEQSATRAVGDPDASFDVLRELDRNGFQLLGYVHNHPGTGADHTRPSTDDQAYQAWLEAAGYDAIGLILTKDGYVRAFSNDLTFNIEIHGNHVERKNKHLFQLEKDARTASSRLADA